MRVAILRKRHIRRMDTRKVEGRRMNQVFLAGRLGKDPEVSYTQGGTAICKFSLATSSKYKGRDGEWREETQWHNIVVWGKQGENVSRYLAKGSYAIVRGEIQYSTYEDNSGNKKYYTNIKADSVEFGPSDNRGGDSGRGRQQGNDNHNSNDRRENTGEQSRQRNLPGYSGPPNDDDIPF